MEGWKRNDWKKSNNTEIENLDLIKPLYKKYNTNFFTCQVEYTKGHAGEIGNELADALATGNIEKFDKIITEQNLTIKKFDF